MMRLQRRLYELLVGQNWLIYAVLDHLLKLQIGIFLEFWVVFNLILPVFAVYSYATRLELIKYNI